MGLLQRRFSDTPEAERDAPLHRLIRLVRFLLALFAPVVAVVAYVTALILARVPRVRWWWVSLPAATVTAVGLWSMSWGPLFLTGWRETAAALMPADLSLWGRVVIDTFAGNWWRWLVAQLPLSLPLGLAIGAALAGRRRVRAPKYREPERKELTFPKQQAKLAKLDLWPQPEQKPAHRTLMRQHPACDWGYGELVARLGVTPDGKAFDVKVAALARQMFIDGPSGAGKTTYIIEYIRSLLEAPAARTKRFPLIFMTMKPAADITEAIAGICERTGRAFHIVTENGRRDATIRYNPIGRGNAFEVAEYVLATEHARSPFNQTFFQEGATRITTFAVRALFELVEGGHTYTYAGTHRYFRRDIWHLAFLHNLNNLSAHQGSYSAELQDLLQRFLTEADDAPVMRQFCVEMAMRLSNFVESEASNVVTWDETGLDLEHAIDNGDVVMFNLDPMQQPRAATSLGFYAIQELTMLCAHFGLAKWGIDPATGDRERTMFFFVDEFSALGGSQLGTLYDRARSYGFGIALSVQHDVTLEDISPGFRSSVLTNANVMVIMRQRESAEAYAQIMGTKLTVKETQQILEDVDLLGSQMIASGQGSLRETREHIVHPDTLRNLRDGQACILIGSESFGSERRVDIVTLRNTRPTPAATPPRLAEQPALASAVPVVPTPQDQAGADDVEPAPEELDPFQLETTTATEFYLTAAQSAARISERLNRKISAAAFQKMVQDGDAPAPAPAPQATPGTSRKWAQTVIEDWIDHHLAATPALEEGSTEGPAHTLEEDHTEPSSEAPDEPAQDDDDLIPEDDEPPVVVQAPEEELTEPTYG